MRRLLERLALLPRPPPPAPREARADRALDSVLGAAVLLSLAIGLADRAGRDSLDAVGPLGLDAPGGGAAPWESLPVDVSTDPPWLLRLLPGIGPARALAIAEDRRLRGPVGDVRDLVRIRGFGPKTVDSLRAAGALPSGAAGAGTVVGSAAMGRSR